jgi:hypothetical protein
MLPEFMIVVVFRVFCLNFEVKLYFKFKLLLKRQELYQVATISACMSVSFDLVSQLHVQVSIPLCFYISFICHV